jgi:hypothetical protein
MKWSRLLKVLAVLAALVTGLVVAAPPASAAEQACNYDNTFNACLRLDYNGYLWWSPHVGLDVHMAQWYAQSIVDCGGNFQATLWGDDGGGSSDDKITDLVLQPGWPSAGPTGLGVEFALPNLYETRLDEDDDSEDEIYARISYFDCNTRLTQTFRTGTIHGYF